MNDFFSAILIKSKLLCFFMNVEFIKRLFPSWCGLCTGPLQDSVLCFKLSRMRVLITDEILYIKK